MIIKECAWCKKEFEAKHDRVKCCCSLCSEEYRKEAAKRYQREHKKIQEKPKRYCERCGKEITGNRKKYCSDKCYVLDHKRTGKPTNCVRCGNEFIRKHTELYCSDECRKKARREGSKSVRLEVVNAPKKKPKKNNLATVEQKARELGLTYGEYQAHLYAGDLDEYMAQRQRKGTEADNIYKSTIGAGRAHIKRKIWGGADE